MCPEDNVIVQFMVGGHAGWFYLKIWLLKKEGLFASCDPFRVDAMVH
jgi:hypothetical protein